jgi:hypothetical protein
MLFQWIIVGILIAGAVLYLGRLIRNAFKRRSCPGCSTMPIAEKQLRKMIKRQKQQPINKSIQG